MLQLHLNNMLNQVKIKFNNRGVSFLEIKSIKTSKLENDELLDVQKQISSFLKFLNSEYETVKKLEEENS